MCRYFVVETVSRQASCARCVAHSYDLILNQLDQEKGSDRLGPAATAVATVAPETAPEVDRQSDADGRMGTTSTEFPTADDAEQAKDDGVALAAAEFTGTDEEHAAASKIQAGLKGKRPGRRSRR